VIDKNQVNVAAAAAAVAAFTGKVFFKHHVHLFIQEKPNRKKKSKKKSKGVRALSD
jgi:hypothetical protein